jgi:UDP-3-O-[3-hydroxymyristoyl] glucosamine N-acyltransferase
VSFAAGAKAAALAERSQAGCLLVSHDFRNDSGRTVIRVSDPRAALARIIRLLHPEPPVDAGLHPTAVVSQNATLGAGVSIGPYVTVHDRAQVGDGTSVAAGCVIGRSTRLGKHCVLHPNVTVYHGVSIGDRAVLHSGCVIGADGFGFVLADGCWQKFPQVGTVEIADDVEIGANSCVDRAALGVTRIGAGTKLDNMVHVAHNCSIGRHVVVAAQTGFSGGVVVEDYAVIGGQVGIGDKAKIESGAVLGSGCGVLTSKIVRGGQTVWGTPARPLKEYLEVLAAQAKLPEMRRQLRELEQKLEELTQRLAAAK